MSINQDGTVVLISDTHIGGSTSLMPPVFRTQDGVTLKPSRAQGWLWECWQDVCATVKSYSRHESIFVIHCGDVTEGNHHDTMQILTQDDTAHADMAVEVLDPLMQHANGCAFVRGTSAHVGGMAYLERLVASQFISRGLVKHEGALTHPVFKAALFGKRYNVAHHVRGGQTHRLRVAALYTMVERSTMSSLWHDTPLPHYMVRGHTHHYADTDGTYSTRAFTVPCWQLPTDFSHKIAADQMPHIGAMIIRNGAVELLRYPILKEDRKYPVIKIDYAKKTKAIA